MTMMQNDDLGANGAGGAATGGDAATGFVALDVALEMAEAMAPAIALIDTRDKSLADQTRRAVQSVVLNIAESRKRRGRDRIHGFRVASGSGEEARAALRLAAAWGYVAASALEAPLGLLDRVLAMLWKLGH